MGMVQKCRVNIPVNVCVTVDRADGEDDGAVSAKAVALVNQLLAGDAEDALKDWGYTIDEGLDVRLYSTEEGYALINSSIEDEWEEEEEEEKEEVPNG